MVWCTGACQKRVRQPVVVSPEVVLLCDPGREVLRMYARLRGVAVDSREALAERLLQRLGLARYADR